MNIGQWAMDNEEGKKTYCVRRLGDQARPYDGVLSPQAWQKADLLSDFSFPWLDRQAPETLFRALWDDENFYFRYDVEDADVVMVEGANSMEKVMGSDRVEIFFTTGDELDPYYGLEMDPRGEVLPYETRYHREFNWDWSCPELQVWPELTEQGYNLEGAIPLQTFRDLACWFEKDGQPYLKAGLFRAEFSHGAEGQPVVEDWISWVDPKVEVPDFHLPSAFGVLEFVGE